MNAPSLARLADELERVARSLRLHEPGDADRSGPMSAGSNGGPPPGQDLAMRLYRERRERDRVLASPGVAMSEPSWDMLLMLYALHGAEPPLAVSNVTEAGGNASTTGLRHLQALEGAGLVCRHDDPRDRRRTLIELSHLGMTRMRLVLEALMPERRVQATTLLTREHA